VRIGTRFLAAIESSAHPDYIAALLGASAADTVLTEAFSVGWPNAPHRVLRSCVTAAEASSDEIIATAQMAGEDMPVPRFASLPPSKAVRGNISAMALYAGTSVDGVRTRQSAAEIVSELCAEIS
jgi:NAD(P)H-dependent flavin oxidoreductase YrpB (nitropropane dioxygenase family)